MALYTLSEAAKATGLNRSTLFRAIRAGKISATRDEQKQWVIDPAELHRVYPVVAPDDAANSAQQHDASGLQRALEAQIAGLREIADLLRAQRDDALAQRADALSQRDKWEAAFQQAQCLLSAPQSHAPPETTPEAAPAAPGPEPEVVPEKPTRRRRLWRWLNG
jgi:excisionase family DNA binding protein